MLDIDGNAISMSVFGAIGYGTLEPGAGELEEQISFTGLTNNANGTVTLTGVSSVGFTTPFTVTSGLTKSHAGSTTFVISNTSGFYTEYTSKRNNEVITNNWTVPDPISAGDIANRGWVLSVVNGGAVSTSSVVVSGTAGETITAGQVVYLKVSDGFWYKASSAASSTTDLVQLGIAQGSGSVGVSISGGVLVKGVDTHQAGLVQGTIYYLSTNGAIASTAGTVERAIGQASSATALYFDPDFYYTPTATIKAASAGNSGTVGSTNRYLTENYIATTYYSADTDQTQSTQNSSTAAGESNSATTKRYLVAQKFVPAKGTINGVSLYKSADTGTFTGTVKVALQIDSAGNPSGSDLASFTITNAVWMTLANSTEFSVSFSSEYSSLTIGGSYWIVVTPSTADDANHINLGVNTAGGYAPGVFKYFNNMDGWVTVTTTMMYFKTLQGIQNKVLMSDSVGLVPTTIRPYSLLSLGSSVVTVNGSSAENTVASKQVTGNFFTANSGFKFKFLGETTAASGVSNTLTWRVKFNGTTITTGTISVTGSGAGNIITRSFTVEGWILNNNSLSTQVVWGTVVDSPKFYVSAAPSGGSVISQSEITLSSSVNTNTPGVIQITYQNSNNDAATISTFRGFIIEKIAA